MFHRAPPTFSWFPSLKKNEQVFQLLYAEKFPWKISTLQALFLSLSPHSCVKCSTLFSDKKNNSLFFSHRFPRCDRARNLFYPHRKISFFPTTIHNIYKHMNDNKIATPPHKPRHLIFISLSKHDLTHKRTTDDIAHIFKKNGADNLSANRKEL